MCKPSEKNTCRVIIAGAGPAGLLLQALLLERNKNVNSRVQYSVTLIESREDLGKLDPETELIKHRSWMIGLAGHGVEAIRSVPTLYDEYVSGVGVEVNEVSIFLGSKKITNKLESKEGEAKQENFIVDRNFIVAALSRFANEKHSDNPMRESKYNTELLYVDHENHRVRTRDVTTKDEEYLDYDLLVGADGMRSTVREALVKRHFDFELEVSDIFSKFKAVHVDCPKEFTPETMSILPGCLPCAQGISLPEKDGKVNISIGFPRNTFDSLPAELKSDDPKTVVKYFRENMKAFDMSDDKFAMDFAEQWATTRWNRTGMVHCNMYHSLPCKIVLMGDSAHATSPSIGMGMNTALRDAQKFNEILDRFDDKLDVVLPEYSKERVPEGNSLTDLALNLYCFDQKAQIFETVHMIIRSKLNVWFPSLVDTHPQNVIGNPKWPLARVYQLASNQGIIQKHRATNDRIRQEYFERQTGMITSDPRGSLFPYKTAGLISIIAAGVGIFYSAPFSLC